jgi:Zn-dependent alcohol dehydrogenase
MRAAVLSTVGGDLEIEDLRDPEPRIGEVLVEVAACGVCHSDLHVMRGEIAFPLPAVLGHEISGTIVALGGSTMGLELGQRIVSSFIMPCGTCRRCAQGSEELCETFFKMNRLHGTLYDGETRLYRREGEPIAMYSMGGLAEMCVVPATDVFPVPDGFSLGELATLGCSALTAYGAVRTVADLRPGDTVAVVGTGGIGLSIIQLSVIFGATEIVAIDVADDKLDAATRLGATTGINVRKTDPVAAIAEITKGRGVDVCFEAFGGAESFKTALNTVGDGGAVVVAGIAPSGVTGELDLMRLPRRKLRILGTFGGRPRTHMPALIDLVDRGVFQPAHTVSRHFDLAHANDAYGALGRGEIVGRAVIDMSVA